jgi:predicted DCC family thiol-disulfide oxidoreductase YuxK
MTRPVLLYDADCRLCRLAARAALVLDRDEALAVLPLRDLAAEGLLASLPPEERYASWRLVRPDGSLVGYGAGVPELLRATRLGRPVGRLLELVPRAVLDAAYRLVARHRGRLGRLLPDSPAPRRWP